MPGGAILVDQPPAGGAIEHPDGGAIRFLRGRGGRGGADALDGGARPCRIAFFADLILGTSNPSW